MTRIIALTILVVLVLASLAGKTMMNKGFKEQVEELFQQSPGLNDKYFSPDQGRLVVSLFFLFRVADEQGPTVDQAELLRWLGESVWFPTNLLPRKNLQWSAIDSSRARLTFNYNGISVYYVVTFNERHEIVRLETERYMGDKGLKPCVGKVSEYTEIQGVRAPSVIEASWDLDEGMYTYGRFRVKQMEYDVPERYR